MLAISPTITISFVMRRRRLGNLAAFCCRIMIFRAKPRRSCFCFIRLIAKLKCVSCRRQLNKFCSDVVSTHSRIENLRTKGIIFDEALRIRVKNLKQTLPENHSKSTKIAITACKFLKIFRRSKPLDPPRAFYA